MTKYKRVYHARISKLLKGEVLPSNCERDIVQTLRPYRLTYDTDIQNYLDNTMF